MQISDKSKAIGAAVGGVVGYNIGEPIAELLYWGLTRVGLGDIPQGALTGLVVALCSYAAVYWAPRNAETVRKVTTVLLLALVTTSCAGREMRPGLPQISPLDVSRVTTEAITVAQQLQQFDYLDLQEALAQQDTVNFEQRCNDIRRGQRFALDARRLVGVIDGLSVEPDRRLDALRDLRGLINDYANAIAPRLSFDWQRVVRAGQVGLPVIITYLASRPVAPIEDPEPIRAELNAQLKILFDMELFARMALAECQA